MMRLSCLCAATLLLSQVACEAQNAAGGAPPAGAASAASAAIGIKVSGNKLVNAADGRTVQIVGTNISGLETGMPSRWPQFADAGRGFWSDVRKFDSHPLNTVRLPLNEASWLNYTCVDPGSGAAGNFYAAAKGGGFAPDPKGEYQSIVRRAVSEATAAGLYVILDLHWAAPNNAAGQPLCPIGQPAYADADHAPTFWKQVADAFKDNPAVMFELFNEPFGSNVYNNWVEGTDRPGRDALTLRDGGDYAPFLVQNNKSSSIEKYDFHWRVAGMQNLVDAVRSTGATNVILSSPIGWAGEIQTWLSSMPSDPAHQLAVAWHVYGYNKGTAPPLSVLSAGYPIVITETYGLNAIGGYQWAASQNIGYLWWGWGDWDGRPLGSQFGRAPWYHSTPP
jgi:hypothetical protein